MRSAVIQRIQTMKKKDGDRERERERRYRGSESEHKKGNREKQRGATTGLDHDRSSDGPCFAKHVATFSAYRFKICQHWLPTRTDKNAAGPKQALTLKRSVQQVAKHPLGPKDVGSWLIS